MPIFPDDVILFVVTAMLHSSMLSGMEFIELASD